MEKTHRTAYVLGGTGFIGRAVSARLREAGRSVVIIDIKPPSSTGFEFKQLDFGNIADLCAVVEEYSDVFHFADSSVPATLQIQGISQEKTHAFSALCNLVAKKNCRLFFPSSGGTVYGEPQRLPIDESHPLAPKSVYGEWKKIQEEIILHTHLTTGLVYHIIRIANCYGPGSDINKPQGIIGVALQKILQDQPLTIVGQGKQIRDFVYIDDVASLFEAVSRQDNVSATVNASSGIGTTIEAAIALLEQKTNQRLQVLDAPERSYDVFANVLNPALALQLYGWKAETTLEDGIEKMIAAK